MCSSFQNNLHLPRLSEFMQLWRKRWNGNIIMYYLTGNSSLNCATTTGTNTFCYWHSPRFYKLWKSLVSPSEASRKIRQRSEAASEGGAGLCSQVPERSLEPLVQWPSRTSLISGPQWCWALQSVHNCCSCAEETCTSKSLFFKIFNFGYVSEV